MKIAIVGYGRTGKLVEHHALNKGHEIVAIIAPSKGTKIEDLSDIKFDVAIEFSVPEVAMENMKFYAENDMKVIMATTGWNDKINEVKSMFSDSNGAILWSGNFSIGVNLFWAILDKASKIMNKFGDYDVFGHEYHHNKKADSPSGTAIKTAEIVLNNTDSKDTIVTHELSNRPIKSNELHYSSTRGGNIPGTHSIFFDSICDNIEITHTARTRDGFALGSVVCAEWLNDKKGYFEIEDFMREVLA